MKRVLIFVGFFIVVIPFGILVGKYQIFPYKQTISTYQKLRSILNLEQYDSSQRHLSFLAYDPLPSDYQITRTAILNTLIEKYNYGSYLEIGQGQRRENFDLIDCQIKIGVDPNRSLNAAYQITSDEFFAINNDFYDLIFIDGLHHADQVMRDITNSLEVLTENGTIVVHDCNPTSEEMQIVPRIQAMWTGDVWKAWVRLRATRDDLKMYVIDADWGCGIIRRGRQEIISLPEDLTYEFLDKNRERILNLQDVDTFLKNLKRKKPTEIKIGTRLRIPQFAITRIRSEIGISC